MIRFFILSIFFANPAFSQDQVLAQEVVSKCEILSELAASGKVYSDSNELYSKLQEFDSSGKLLIESCESDILEFVSNYCSSQSTQNQDICSRVGISYRDDYKSFGVEALPSFATGYSRLPEVSSSYEFRAAGFLFLISPVRKLKIASGVSKVLRLKARPVLSGAILVLSSLGLASCDDLTEPEITCVEGQFKLRGFRTESCIDLPKISKLEYLDSLGNAVSSTEVTNHNIKVSFDSEVGYINLEGWQKLSSGNVSKVFSIDNLPDNFGQNLVVSEVGGKSVITFSPSDFFPEGNYSIDLTNFAKRSDAGLILSSNNKLEYLNEVKTNSKFTATIFECTKDLKGYFYTTNNQKEEVCLKIPNATWQFAPYLGRYIDYPTADIRTTIKLSFDTEIGYLSESGEFSNLTKNHVLNMLKVAGLDEVNIVGSSKHINTKHIRINHTPGKTEIEISPPDNGYAHKTLSGVDFFSIEFKNFAAKVDASKFSNISSVSEFGNEVSLSYTDKYGGFFVIDLGSSCSVNTPGSTSQIYTGADREHEGWCGSSALNLENLPKTIFEKQNLYTLSKDKADPNTTYQIDVAFIVSNGAASSGVTESFIKDDVIPQVNDIYQDSGVNVRFNAVAVESFSNLRQYLVCSTDLDGVSASDGIALTMELTPKMQKDFNADLVYGFYSTNVSGICGAALLRPGGNTSFPLHIVSRLISYGIVDINCGGALTNQATEYKKYNFIQTLAHEMGHNLGLNHDKHTILTHDEEGKYPYSENFRPSGYGYVGQITHNANQLKYGTIMSYASFTESLPFFSTAGSVKVKDVCTNDSTRHDYDLSLGFCPSISPFMNVIGDFQLPMGGGPDEHGVTVDASEALQYSIEDASNYTPSSSNSSSLVADQIQESN